MTRLTEQQGAAIMSAEGKTGTRPYFDVDDINAGVARVKELGGQAEDAMPVPQMGWFALCEDTEGNAFGLWQTDPAAPAPEGAPG
jgi:predicted enzyme related to lactoylglutathione lyase